MMIELKVEGMSCAHCVRAVTEAIQEKDAGAQVQIDLATGVVRTETGMSRENVAAAIESEGYKITA